MLGLGVLFLLSRILTFLGVDVIVECMKDERELAGLLQGVGLTEKQADVYIALATLGGATVYQIAERCGVKRPTVYVVLEELRRKSLVLKVPHAKKAMFSARDIAEYLIEQKARLTAIDALIPRLYSFSAAVRPNVYFFSGANGVVEAMNFKFESMRGKSFHSFYGNLDNSSSDIVPIYDSWDKKAIEAGISFNIIMSRGKKLQHMGLESLADARATSVSIRFLQQYLFPGNISFEIADDFVRIGDAKNLTSTLIDDRATADAMRQIFKIVWEKGG